ncbi:hypothetical protein C8R44DRAFT_811030 [Mycena epipterygia]|nr:hypothetical protein C8R44DRAFT_811030 [Mycena epipterygia]
MSFSLNGTHIDGGTFNNVAGNMTQVFNSHVSHARMSVGGEREGIHSFLSSTTGSIGAIRSDRVSRHRNGEPYAITNHRHHHDHQQSELVHRNSNSTSGYVHSRRATIALAPAQHNTIARYSPNNQITSTFDAAQLQKRDLFYDSVVENGYNESDGGWSNLYPAQHPIPVPVQYNAVPEYSGDEQHISVDAFESQRRAPPVQRSMLSYQAPSISSETILNNTYNSIGGDDKPCK